MVKAPPAKKRHLVKRYSVTRLYNATTLSYVDVAQLRALIQQGDDVSVVDSKTGKDITATFLRSDV